MKILVTGGTGALGQQLVPLLTRHGADVRVLSRRPRHLEGAEVVRGDMVTGEGLAAGVRGVDVVVHCASDPRRWQGDVEGTSRLLDAAQRAGQPHVVYVSIVGVDRIPFGYYRAKLAAETLIRDCGLPWTLLRATQFHDLVLQIVATLAKLPVMVVPQGIPTQPVDTREVAQQLASLALGPPAGRVPDLGGPRVWSLQEAACAYLAAAGLRRAVVSVPLPGKTARAFRAGGNLVRDGDTGTRTFEEFLSQRVRPGCPVELTYYPKH